MQKKIGILALGNLIRKDEGIGQHILELLRDRVPEHVETLDGGTSGMELLGFIETKERLIILDAVDGGNSPGEVVVWKQDAVPRYTQGKLSAHQMGFGEVLFWAHFIGAAPEEIVVVGIQPESLEWGIGLSPTAQSGLPLALEKVQECLTQWGVELKPYWPVKKAE